MLKKIQKLVLNRLSKKELSFGELNKVKGGEEYYLCGCGCCYDGEPGDPGYGGSSNFMNKATNCKTGLSSPIMCDGENNAVCPMW